MRNLRILMEVWRPFEPSGHRRRKLAERLLAAVTTGAADTQNKIKPWRPLGLPAPHPYQACADADLGDDGADGPGPIAGRRSGSP